MGKEAASGVGKTESSSKECYSKEAGEMDQDQIAEGFKFQAEQTMFYRQ